MKPDFWEFDYPFLQTNQKPCVGAPIVKDKRRHIVLLTILMIYFPEA